MALCLELPAVNIADCFAEYACPKCGGFDLSARSIQQGIMSACLSPISTVKNWEPNGINGFLRSPLNQPLAIPLTQRQSRLSLGLAKLCPRKSSKCKDNKHVGHGGTTVDMDVNNNSS